MCLNKLVLVLACSVLASWGAITGVSVRGVTNTQAVLAYTAPNSSACAVEVSESATYSPLVHDVDGGLFTGAASDARATSVNTGTARQVVIGQRLSQLALDSNVYSRSLQAYTLHYYRITCGTDTATGTFTTANIPFQVNYQDGPQIDPITPGAVVMPTISTTNRTQTIVDPHTGALIRRVSLPSDTTATGPYMYSGGATKMCATSTSGPDSGYLCTFANGNGGYGVMYYIIPATGEARYLGTVVGMTYPFISTDGSIYDFDGTNITIKTYNGNYLQASQNTAVSFTSTPLISGVPAAIHAFNSAFVAANYGCSAAQVTGDYVTIACLRGNRDTYGWLAVVRISTTSVIAAMRVSDNIQTRWCGIHSWSNMWTSAGLALTPHGFTAGNGLGGGPYISTYADAGTLAANTTTFSVSGEPACAACGTDASVPIAQVGDVFTFNADGSNEKIQIITKNSPTSWTVMRGYNGTTPSTHAPGAVLYGTCQPTGGYFMVAWKFLADPNGTDATSTNVVTETAAGIRDGHLDMGLNLSIAEHWPVRVGDLLTEIAQPLTRTVPSEPLFAGKSAPCYGNLCKSHPSVGPTSNWLTDYLGFDTIDNGADTLTPVSGQLYKYGNAGGYGFWPKHFATVGVTGARYAGGPYQLRDVSPAVLGTTSADSYKFCIANAAGECYATSAKGDIYLNVPGSPSACGGADPCIGGMQAYGHGVLQIGTSGVNSRVISNGLVGLRNTLDYPTAKALPDGSYLMFTVGDIETHTPSHLLMAKLPPFTASDSVDRTTFVRAPISITTPSGLGIVSATVEFGYLEQGTPSQHYCTSRREACVAVASTVTDATPFYYKTTDTYTRASCATSCTITIPVLPGHVAYYQPVFYDSGNSVVSSGSPGVVGDFVLTTIMSSGPSPVGISRFIDPWISTWSFQTNVQGDNEMATAWAANSLLPLFADPTGLPVLYSINDSVLGGCSSGGSGLMIVQLSKLAGIGVTATSGNTLSTPVNCMDSYQGGTAPDGTWSDGLSWKGAVMAFRNNRLLAYFYRQANAGNAFTDSSLVISPDAGQTWIDYGRYNGFTVTATACAGTSVTLTATNALSAGQKIYVHNVGAVYDGKQTIATASGSQVTYTVSSCTGATGSRGYFGILATNGSAPEGTGGAYNMMWPASAGRQMVTPSPISYGQDGNYPSGIDSACDPTVYVCGLSGDATGSEKIYLWRVPLGQEMTKASYQWYTCSGYNAYWPVQDTVCDGNNPENWTSTMTAATGLLYEFVSATRPAQMYMMKYLPSHKAYLTANVARTVTGSRLSFYWAPHPWGPFYPVTNSECVEGSGINALGCVPFFALMDYGENVISTSPPKTQIRISAKDDAGTGMGAPGFWTVEAAAGRVPFAGAARRADYMGISGQLGVGHRFVSGNEAGAISRRGSGTNGAYSLDWWTDLWDHGGAITNGATSRPWFRDLISGGAKYINVIYGDGANWHNSLASSQANLTLDGVHVDGSGYGPHLLSSFTDSVLTGNASWTIVVVFKPADTGSSSNRLVHLTHNNTGFTPWDLEVSVGAVSAGDLCVRWASDVGKICTAGSTITPNTWYFLAISAAVNGSGYPTITMSLGNAGAITEFGGTSMATAASGTSAANLTKTCSSCSLTPSIAASGTWWWGAAPGGTGTPDGTFAGIYGELGLYSGVVPSHVIREIYRTLRTDWARVGRGAI